MAKYEKSFTTNTLFYGALDCTMASAQRPQTGQTAAGGGAESSFGGRPAQASANRAPGGPGTAERERDPHHGGP